MSAKQLITVSPSGEISGLQFKKGKGLDLRTFGEAKIIRSSLIEWDEQCQQWYINLLKRGVVTRDVAQQAGLGWDDMEKFNGELEDIGGECIYRFDEYEDAVSAEIAVIQGLRLSLIHI